MGIGSLSGTTLDSAIKYINKEPTADESVKRVIYHLGTNNIRSNSADEIKEKLDTLKLKSAAKFPNAVIGFCEIPPTHPSTDPKIADVNEYIKSVMNDEFLEVNAKDTAFFTSEGVHYNKPGLGRLASSLKNWAKRNGHPQPGNLKQRRPNQKTRSSQNQQRNRRGQNLQSSRRNTEEASQQLINLLLASLQNCKP